MPPGQGRSYFLERLLKDVIFTEAALVAYRPAAERSRAIARVTRFCRRRRAGGGHGGAARHARSTGERAIDATRAALAGYEQVAHGLKLESVADDDLVRLVPLLDAARALPHGAAAGEAASGTPLMLGLSQNAKLAAAARDVYRHALEWALLPRLIWRLEGQLRGNMNRPDFLYEATRIYLMLGSAGPLDASLVHEWMKLDWQTAYPGDQYATLRCKSLLRHLDALLAEPLPPVQLDGGSWLRRRASRFAAVPMAQRVYSRIARRSQRGGNFRMAAERSARAGRRASICARLRQTAERRHSGFLTGGRVGHGAAAVSERGGKECPVGKLGAGRAHLVRSERVADGHAEARRHRAVQTDYALA